MANIKLTGGLGWEGDLTPGPHSAFTKYFKNPPSFAIVQQNSKATANEPLASLPSGHQTLDVSFGENFSAGAGGGELTVSPGIHGKLGVFTAGSLFSSDAYESPLKILPGQAYVDFEIGADLSASISRQENTLGFGFEAGTAVTITNYRLFHPTPTAPTLASAIKDTIQDYVIPATVDDLRHMPAGMIATLEGTGTITFTATADIVTLVNPLAVASAEILANVLQIGPGASIAVGASFELSGEYEIRIRKLDSRKVELGYFRKHGSDLNVSASANAGLTAALGEKDLIASFLGAISGKPSADLPPLNLSPEQTAAIAAALKQAIDRKLQLGMMAQLDFLSSNQEAFLFEADLEALGADGQKMIEDALGSNLALLVENEKSLPPGVQWKSNVLSRAQERGFSLKVNAFGLYNYISLHDLLRTSTIATDAESGEVHITDSTVASRIGLTANFLTQENRVKLRSVLAESFLVTVVYRCSKIVKQPDLSGSYWFFDLVPAAGRTLVEGFYHVMGALGLDAASKASIPASSESFGRAALFIDTEYDSAAVYGLFLKSDGAARGLTEYEGIGRKAMQAVLLPGGVNDTRLKALEDAYWPQVKSAAGNRAALAEIFPEAAEPILMDIYGDWFVIANWSSAMAEASQCLSTAYPYFSQNSDPNSEKFQTLRTALQKQMSSVAQETKDRFADPWGLVALDIASGRKSQARAEIYSEKLTVVVKRES
ncbi:MAG TPA: hypothetical protein VFZ08_03270 [Terriglobia bacterium]|nr:hypothetical protein [Terriglobia bacterium]